MAGSSFLAAPVGAVHGRERGRIPSLPFVKGETSLNLGGVGSCWTSETNGRQAE